MFISFSRIGKLSTACAALVLLSGCTEILSFGVGFGAGFFTGQYYANSEHKEKMAVQAQMAAAEAPIENQAYSQQQAAASQQPAPIPMGGYGGGYYDPYAAQAPMPMAAPAYDPYAAQPPAYAAAPAAYPDPAYGAVPQGGYPPLPATNAPAYAAAPAAYPAPQGYGGYPPVAAPAYGYQ